MDNVLINQKVIVDHVQRCFVSYVHYKISIGYYCNLRDWSVIIANQSVSNLYNLTFVLFVIICITQHFIEIPHHFLCFWIYHTYLPNDGKVLYLLKSS